MTIDTWLKETTALLKVADIPSARLDTMLLLEYQLGISKEQISAHPEMIISSQDISKLNKLRLKRIKHNPMAYIIGKKEFYGREFLVNGDTLIPRPETEDIIDLTKSFASSLQHPCILDVGTGSGCIGITLALEIPASKLTLADISKKALAVAKTNAKNLGADVNFKQSDLLESIDDQYDIIVANLPYVDSSWEVSKETKYEPPNALFANVGGLELIYKLIERSKNNLKTGGYLILEADPVQHQNIVRKAISFGFKKQTILGYGLVFKFQSLHQDQAAKEAAAKQSSPQ